VDLLAVVAGATGHASALAAEEATAAGLQINFFWVIVSSLNFIVFAILLYQFFGKTVQRLLAERRERIETGLRDAEQARLDREKAEAERVAALNDARREANDIINRAQRVAQETRDADIAATRQELERMRERAAGDIEAEKQRAIADLRAEVADLALTAAGKVVGETMTGPRQRRLVKEFLEESATPTTPGRNG
jgi:F-type H+-transporting ATPase subunit b